MRLSYLPELKQMLLHEKNFGPVWEYFMVHCAENPEFLALGESARHTLVEEIVTQVAKQMFSGPGDVKALVLSRVPKEQFVHGGFFVDGRLGAVFYFEDAQTGLMSVAEGPPSDQVKFARFSGRIVRDGAPPSRN
jgi:hypothetical protein